MPQNQYLPFATGAGANTLTYAQYAALGALLAGGFQSGVALSAQVNTLLRQASTAVSGIAQFIADNQTADVLDDGVPANFEAKFKVALLSAVESEGVVFTSDGGTPDALVATPSPALTAYKVGQVIAVQKNASVGSNTTAAPTINLNGLGAVTITKASGAQLYAGDLPQGGLFFAVFDGTYFRHIGLTLSTADLRVQAGQAVVFASSGTNAYTGALTPAPTALTPRMEVLGFFGAANTSAAAPTLLLNGLGAALPILKQNGGVPAPGDVAGIVPLVLNTAGTAWIINGLATSDVLALIATNASVVRVTDAAAASTAQALVGTASPAISAYSPTQIFIFTAAANNTAGGPTLNVTGAGGTALGALTIVRRDLSSINQGDLASGATYIGSPDATGSKLRLLGQLPSDTKAVLNAGPKVTPYQTPGSYSYVVGPNTTSINASRVNAGGGGGGGSTGTGAAGGGGGGGWNSGRLAVTPGQTITINVGGGGAGASGGTTGSGGTGGTSSVSNGSVTIAATGGTGGQGAGNGGQGVSGGGGSYSGGTLGFGGANGSSGFYTSAGAQGGSGGSAGNGGGGGGSSSGGSSAGAGPGGGGSGGANGSGGAQGASGIVVIEEYV